MEGIGQFGSKANKQYGSAVAERPPSPAPDSAAMSAHQIGYTRGDGPQPDWVQLEHGLRQHGYKDLKVLGKGVFGRAYKATNRTDETVFVIKVSLSQQDEELLAEYRLMNDLAHPNSPSVYDCLIIEDLPIVVMDFCAGGDLHDKLSKQSTIEPKRLRGCSETMRSHQPSASDCCLWRSLPFGLWSWTKNYLLVFSSSFPCMFLGPLMHKEFQQQSSNFFCSINEIHTFKRYIHVMMLLQSCFAMETCCSRTL